MIPSSFYIDNEVPSRKGIILPSPLVCAQVKRNCTAVLLICVAAFQLGMYNT